MQLARRAVLASMMAALASPAVLRLARAGVPQVTFKLHHFFSSVSCGHEKFLAPWARKVEAQSGGRIRIDIFPSMQLGGAPAQLFDQVRDGLADIVWAMPGSTPGRFAGIETFELPFVSSRRALVNSKALEDFAAANLNDEFRDVHPICFSCRDHAVLHVSRAVRSIADLRGLRLRVPNRLAAETAQALGARGVSVPIPQVPIAIGERVIDGCLDPWDVVPGLRLNDLLKFHSDFAESSPSTSTFVLAMSKTAYERLPSDLRMIIDDHSGQPAAATAGAMWDQEAAAAASSVRQRGDPLFVLDAEDVAHWRAATEPVIAVWTRQMKERRLDGGKLIDSARMLLARYANEPEPQPPPLQGKPEFTVAPKTDTPAAPAKSAPGASWPGESEIPL